MRKPRTLDEDSPADRALNYAVGKRIRELRQDKNMTQKQLSELSDIKATYITLIEAAGVNLSLKLLQRLADALGVTPRDLLPARDQGETPSVTIEIVRKKVADLAEQVRNLEAVVAKPKH
ncbi:MAG: helix-turn-helix transcriptional regulator [Acetobacteraceae bacterium]